jgi:hypothetical protein
VILSRKKNVFAFLNTGFFTLKGVSSLWGNRVRKGGSNKMRR